MSTRPEGKRPWGQAKRTALKPASTLLASVITFLILLWGTRNGQFADIAGYTAGSSLGAITSAIAGSGTSLAFITGDVRTQVAVQKVRYRLVVPSLFLAALLGSIVYGLGTDLEVMSVAAGGLSVALNNLTELESARLERRVDTEKLLFCSVTSRLIGLASAALGVTFSLAMLLCAVSGYVLTRVFSRSLSPASREIVGMRDAIRLSYDPGLMTVSVLGIIVTRLVPALIPFFMLPTDAGALAALISSQQNVAAVLISGLYTVMAARSEAGKLQEWMSKVTAATMTVAAVVAVVAAFASPVVVAILKLDSVPEAGLWWALLAFAIFPYTLNRQTQYSLLGAGHRAAAARLLFLNVGLLTICVVIAMFSNSDLLWAMTSLTGEGVTSIVVLLVGLRSRRRQRG